MKKKKHQNSTATVAEKLDLKDLKIAKDTMKNLKVRVGIRAGFYPKSSVDCGC